MIERRLLPPHNLPLSSSNLLSATRDLFLGLILYCAARVYPTHFLMKTIVVSPLQSNAREEHVGPAVSALQRAIAEVKQRWSVIEWVTKY
jgi:hypothetical protein